MTTNSFVHPRTQLLNRVQAQQANQARVDALKWLSEAFPEAFDTEKRVRPLKKGILKDLYAHLEQDPKLGFSKTKIRETVVMFTRRMEYLVCVKLRDDRVDLEGNFAGHVTDEEAEYAAEKIRQHVESAIEKADKPPRSRRYEACDKFAPRMRDVIRNEQQKRANSVSQTAPQHHYPSDHNYYQRSINMPMQSDSPSAISASPSSAGGVSNGAQTQVTVKRKVSKRIDPEAVARLKGKLGIKKETA